MSRPLIYKKAVTLGYNGSIKWPKGSLAFWKAQVKILSKRLPRLRIIRPKPPRRRRRRRRRRMPFTAAQLRRRRRKIRRRVRHIISVNLNRPPITRHYGNAIFWNKEVNVWTVRDILKKFNIRGVVRILFFMRDRLEVDVEYNVPILGINRWWNINNLIHDWMFGSIHSVFFPGGELLLNTMRKIIIVRPTKVKSRKIFQRFKEGLNNCFLLPIEKWIDQKLVGASTRQKRRYDPLKTKINDYKILFRDGAPQDRLQEFANSTRFCIEILDPLRNTYLKFEPDKKSLSKFTFINTKINHVNLDQLVGKNSATYLDTPRDMLNKKNELVTGDKFHIYNKYCGKITSIQTLCEHYRLKNDFGNYCIEFEKSTGLDKCKLDAIKNPELTEFIKLGTHVSSCINFRTCNGVTSSSISTSSSIKHIDQIKCYTQFKVTPYYQGFPARITDFRMVGKNNDVREFLINHIGYFYVKNINNANVITQIKRIFNSLNIYNEDCVLPSVELVFLLDHGYTFDIIYGAWGTTIKFRFDGVMMIKRDEGVPYYSKWSGRCGMINTTDKFIIDCESEMANHLASTYPNVRYYTYVHPNGTDARECEIIFKKQKAMHLCHVFGFITSYARLNLYEQLFKIQHENILRVVMDGIYYKDCNFNLSDTFRHKDPTITCNASAEKFFYAHLPDINLCKFMKTKSINSVNISSYYKTQLYVGPGGSGKTYNCLKNNGYVDLIYVTPGWKLARSKKLEHETISVTVLARLLGECCISKYKYSAHPSVIIIDEATMLNNDRKNKILTLYPYSKIIFCGDFDENGDIYQLPPIKGLPMNFIGIDSIVKFTKNRRCTCPLLQQILTNMRKDIKLNRFNFNHFIEIMNNYGRVIREDSMEYSINDFILCSRRSCRICKKKWCAHNNGDNFVQYWTNKYKGRSMEKYLITKSDKKNSTGNIIISETRPPNSEIRHAFTIHAIQGETCANKLFIDLRQFFDHRMAYTALSRAKSLDQIYLINVTEIFN